MARINLCPHFGFASCDTASLSGLQHTGTQTDIDQAIMVQFSAEAKRKDEATKKTRRCGLSLILLLVIAAIFYGETSDMVDDAAAMNQYRLSDNASGLVLDDNGHILPNYVHDEKFWRRNPVSFTLVDDELSAACSKQDNHSKMLQKVLVAKDTDQADHKIFCAVFDRAGEGVAGGTVQAIRETWGPKCDGFLFASNTTNQNLGTVRFQQTEGKDNYNGCWQKVRSMLVYIYEHYYGSYDWFYIGDDNVPFVLVENLRRYLGSKSIIQAANNLTIPAANDDLFRHYAARNSRRPQKAPLYLGRRYAYMGDMGQIFNAGAPGYVLNREALKRLVVDGLPHHHVHTISFAQDTIVAQILRALGIVPFPTRDEEHEERFMPFAPGHHYSYRWPKLGPQTDWYAQYAVEKMRFGLDHCSKYSIIFSYNSVENLRRFYALKYGLCSS